MYTHGFFKYFKAIYHDALIISLSKNKLSKCRDQVRSKKWSSMWSGDADALWICRWLLSWIYSSSSGLRSHHKELQDIDSANLVTEKNTDEVVTITSFWFSAEIHWTCFFSVLNGSLKFSRTLEFVRSTHFVLFFYFKLWGLKRKGNDCTDLSYGCYWTGGEEKEKIFWFGAFCSPFCSVFQEVYHRVKVRQKQCFYSLKKEEGDGDAKVSWQPSPCLSRCICSSQFR